MHPPQNGIQRTIKRFRDFPKRDLSMHTHEHNGPLIRGQLIDRPGKMHHFFIFFNFPVGHDDIAFDFIQMLGP